MTHPAARRDDAPQAHDETSGEAWTFVLDFYDPTALPAAAVGRITDDRYVLAHLERPGPASVRAMLAAALERGHVATSTPTGENDELPVASVVVMTAGCAGRETWEVPTAEGLAWWIDAVDFRSVTRERYFAAFPRVDDGRDTDPEWLAIRAGLARRDGP